MFNFVGPMFNFCRSDVLLLQVGCINIYVETFFSQYFCTKQIFLCSFLTTWHYQVGTRLIVSFSGKGKRSEDRLQRQFSMIFNFFVLKPPNYQLTNIIIRTSALKLSWTSHLQKTTNAKSSLAIKPRSFHSIF